MMEFKTLMENLQLDTHIVGYGSLNHLFINCPAAQQQDTRTHSHLHDLQATRRS